MPSADPLLTDSRRVRLIDLAQDWRFSVILLFVFSVAIHLIGIHRSPHVDEIYCILAARGWLAHGEPRIADGLYPRAELFTILLAGSLKMFGDNLAAARLPSLVAGSLLVVALFLWTRLVAGSAAAWIAALFLCLSTLSFQLFLWARFYALHALLFWLGAIAIYALVEQRLGLRSKLGLILGISLALLLALHLQPLTLLGVAAIAAWLGLAVVLPWLWCGRADWRWRALTALGAILLTGVVLLAAQGLLAELWRTFRFSPPHSAAHRNELWFYHLLLLKRYQAIWSLFPFVALIALAQRPRPALFCLCIFATVFVLESLAGMKDQRYLFFVMPFLFALCGMALAAILKPLWQCLSGAAERAAAALLPTGLQRPVKWAALGVSLLFLIGASGAATKVVLMFAGVRLSAEEEGIEIGKEYDGDAWSAASGPVKPWLKKASIVVTMGEEFTLYYLGDYDILIDDNRAVELGKGEFALDPRNGRLVVSTVASVERILDCYPDGVILVDTEIWRQPSRVGDAVADLIERRTTRADLPTTPRIKLFHWQRARAATPESCAGLPKVAGRSG